MCEDYFTEADLIVCACDPGHSGAVAFDVLMAVVFGDERAKSCPALLLKTLDEVSVRKGFAEMRPFGEACCDTLEYGLVKRYFEWNWNVNALAVLSDAARRAGVAKDAPPLSKYALQLMYAMRDLGPTSDGNLVSIMTQWAGTGTYKSTENQASSLGSVASRVQILVNLIESGLLNRTLRDLTLSDRGRKLLDLLHPDCQDADLPFRLDAWCSKGVKSKTNIDRYIKTFFGKQLRFKTGK